MPENRGEAFVGGVPPEVALASSLDAVVPLLRELNEIYAMTDSVAVELGRGKWSVSIRMRHRDASYITAHRHGDFEPKERSPPAEADGAAADGQDGGP